MVNAAPRHRNERCSGAHRGVQHDRLAMGHPDFRRMRRSLCRRDLRITQVVSRATLRDAPRPEVCDKLVNDLDQCGHQRRLVAFPIPRRGTGS